ncbi:hypothetical protein GC089_08760 [Cellulomonas sp. JZ18]|uniref:hypothetical protein n=1 Tax=Cellulomonas sp. JZ18 TaxID=2654191 RepID=UPI0012D39C85|nr:hypothetical protein [Cellulomonas sp. JZ18]QGQ19305.1 hypothetical protein GC089_08760 [Cellulomonas sp. JZ18]
MSEDTVHPAQQRPETQDPENQPLPGSTESEQQPSPGDTQDQPVRRIYPSDPTGQDPDPTAHDPLPDDPRA